MVIVFLGVIEKYEKNRFLGKSERRGRDFKEKLNGNIEPSRFFKTAIISIHRRRYFYFSLFFFAFSYVFIRKWKKNENRNLRKNRQDYSNWQVSGETIKWSKNFRVSVDS